MGITIGDALTVVSLIGGTCLALWAMMVGMVMLFSRRAGQAAAHLERSPAGALLIGAVLTTAVVVANVVLQQAPNGLVRLIGWSLIYGALSISLVGASGLAMLVGGRIQRMDGRMSAFSGLTRGAALIVIAGLLPLLGWFLFIPLIMMFSLGAGLQATFYKGRPASVPALGNGVEPLITTPPPYNLENVVPVQSRGISEERKPEESTESTAQNSYEAAQK
jgi:hypothetical protein